MGVENLWEFLEEHCPLANKEELPSVDGLFIDLPQFTCPRYNSDTITEDGYLTTKFYDGVMDDIKQVVESVRPKYFLYIGADGKEPAAKIWTTIARKEGKVGNRPLSIDVHLPTGDYSMDQILLQRISELKKIDLLWRNLWIIFDPKESPGEAEIKFIQYLRYDSYAKQASWCICSRDSDFVPLLLSLHRGRLWIRRDWNSNWNVDVIRTDLRALFDGDRGIDDFIALMSLVGNDFLPAIIKDFTSKKGNAIDQAVAAYQTLSGHLVVDGDIDPKVLKELLLKLQNSQEQSVAATKRTDAMGDAYLHGIRWFTHMFLSVHCDWYWAYIFERTDTPAIDSIINRIDHIDMSRESVPPEDLDVSELKFVHLAKRLPTERIDEMHEKFIGQSMDEIYSPDDGARLGEKFRKLITSRTLARQIAMELGDEPMVVTRGLLWICKGDNSTFQRVTIPPQHKRRCKARGKASRRRPTERAQKTSHSSFRPSEL